MATAHEIWDRLSSVIEPELGLPLTELGLIYDVTVNETGSKAIIKMTLTSPACPLAPEIVHSVRQALGGIEGLEDAHVEIVFDPPWDPYTMASDKALDALGL